MDDIIYNIIIVLLILVIGYIYFSGKFETFVTEEGFPLMKEIKKRNKIFVDYIYFTYKDSPHQLLKSRAIFLYNQYNPEVIREHFPNLANKATSYVEDKGKEIGYCLKANNGKGRLEDINTMMYVSIHELTHIYLYDINQHPQEFFVNFKFLLQQAVDIGLYKPVDYGKTPIKYCGMTLTSNVLFQ